MKKLNQQGAVAMISVIIFSIIISILAMAYARTIISQQRQSINYDLSTRAYYAAESGVQDAVRYLRGQNPADANSILVSGQNSCKNGSEYLGSDDGVLGTDKNTLAYTCQLVDPTPGELTGSTSADSVLWKIIPAQAANDDYKVTIKWSNPDSDQKLVPREGSTSLTPPIPGWRNSSGDTYHPQLRASFITAPPNARRSDYGQQVYFLNPTTQNATDISVNPQAGVRQNPGSVAKNSTCNESDSSGGYKCSQVFEVPKILADSGNLYLVVHSVYAKTNYEVTISEKTSGRQLGFKNNVLTVDVTARAGDVFRRVKQQVPISGGYKESWFDASGLVVGDGICKLFSIGTTASQFSSECQPTSTTSPTP